MTDSIVNGDGIRGTLRHAIRVTNESPCGAQREKRATRRSGPGGVFVHRVVDDSRTIRRLRYMETGGETTPPSASHSSVFTKINGGRWYATRGRKREPGPLFYPIAKGWARSAHTSFASLATIYSLPMPMPFLNLGIAIAMPHVRAYTGWFTNKRRRFSKTSVR